MATILVTTIAVTLLIHLVPGDPVQIMYAQSQGTTPEQIEAIRANLGLDRSIPVQYLQFMGRLMEGRPWIHHPRPPACARPPAAAPAQHAGPRCLRHGGSPSPSACRWGSSPPTSAAPRSTRPSWSRPSRGSRCRHFWARAAAAVLARRRSRLAAGRGHRPRQHHPARADAGVVERCPSSARMTRSSMIDVMGQDFVRTAHAKGAAQGAGAAAPRAARGGWCRS